MDHTPMRQRSQNFGSTSRLSSISRVRPASSLSRARSGSSLNSGSVKRLYMPSRLSRSPTKEPPTGLRRRASSAALNTPVRSVSRLSRRPSSAMSISSSSSSSESRTTYTGTINVAIRPRPLPDDARNRNVWNVNPEANCVFNREAGEYFYDQVFSPDVMNESVYSKVVEPVVSKCLDGFNGTVFAYGMTGSGKTYSMQGDCDMDQVGLIDLCVDQIFQQYGETSARGAINSVSCSYLEIYNERLYDLLNVSESPQRCHSSLGMHAQSEELRIRDDSQYGVKVVGLTEIDVPDAQTLRKAIKKGDQFRRTSSTDYNARSSRSHAILLIRLNSRNAPDQPQTTSTLCLCDLAGSEKATLQVERRKEGSFINKSLLALGTVIAKLSEGNSGHIPYRDSKLTRLLQPSLSGNAIISVLCTIHLSSQTFGETCNTLRFAARAKNVTYNASKMDTAGAGGEKSTYSERFVDTLIKENEQLKKRIHTMEQQQKLQSSAGGDIGGTSGGALGDVPELVAENKILSEQLEHQKRLNEERMMEQVMYNNESLQQLTQFPFSEDPRFQESLLNFEEFSKTMLNRVEEMRSYIMHLEQQLKEKEKEAATPTTNSSSSSYSSSSSDSSSSTEIAELKEMLRSKDTMIKALKSAKSMRDMFERNEDRENVPPLTAQKFVQ